MSADDLAARLPDIGTVRSWWQSLAALDAVLSPEWNYRYFSFDSRWDVDEQMASLRTGSGDDASITFTHAGAYLRGFDHESPLSPYMNDPVAPFPGLLERVPAALQDAVHDAAWQHDGVPVVTVSLWRLTGDDRWHVARAQDPPPGADDGSDWLFADLDGQPETYLRFATDYYEPDQPLDRSIVEHVYAHRPMTADLGQRLNPAIDWNTLREDLAAIGYPTAEP